MVAHPAPPQTRTCAMHAYGASSRASAAPWCSPRGSGDTMGARNVSRVCLPIARSARRRLPSRGSLGPHFPTFIGTIRRYDCPLSLSEASLVARLPDTLPASRVRSVPHGLVPRGKPPGHARAFGHPVPHSGYGTRRQVALPSSRVPPVKTCPALRPRWCPAHSPSRPQDCCLPALAHRRLPTTLPALRHH